MAMPTYAMYIIANQGLEMSSGKLAAQVAHAAVRAFARTDYKITPDWFAQGEMKVVLQARDEAHMRNVLGYLDQHLPEVDPYVVIDEGRTEVPSLSMTAIGLPVMDKDDERVKFVMSNFKLYKDLPKPDTNIYVSNSSAKQARWWDRR